MNDVSYGPNLSGAHGLSVDLLARALLSPVPAARAAWATWRSKYDLDRTSWAEVRMLGALAERVDLLDPTSHLSPRMRGIRKFLWVTSQACLTASAPGLARMVERGIPCLLMKGVARIAANRAVIAERLIRDVDVLIPWQQSNAAFDVLVDDGWAFTGWQVDARQVDSFAAHHAWSLTRGRGELDVHHFSNTLNRLVGDDDGLWQRSRVSNWNGIEVRLPSATDGLLISLLHGARFSIDGGADWLVDATRLIEQGEVDWALLLREAKDRAVSAIVWRGLTYLNAVNGQDLVPATVRSSLELDAGPAQFAELSVYAKTNWPSGAAEESALIGGAIERVGRIAATARRELWPVGRSVTNQIQAFTLQPGLHDLSVPVDANRDTNASTLRVAVHSPKLLMQSSIEAQYVGAGLSFGKAIALADAHGVAHFQLTLPSALLLLRRVETLKLSIFVPGYVGDEPVSVQLAWI